MWFYTQDDIKVSNPLLFSSLMVRQRAFGLVLFHFRLKLYEYMCVNGRKIDF